MGSQKSICVSAPCKVHLLGEHSVVYGKPAILASVNLRVYVQISPTSLPLPPTNVQVTDKTQAVIEPIIKRHLQIKQLPPYNISINTEVPIGSGLGSSAAISASYIAALLSFLKVKWDLNLVNNLAYNAEKVFHGNPSGADNSTVTFGGLVWYRKETPDLKIIKKLDFSIPKKLAKNFILINTGRPKETTKDMVVGVKKLYDQRPKLVNKFLEDQEKLVRELLTVIKEGSEDNLIRIIRAGERNLESIGVCSTSVKKIIRKIEKSGGATKICGAGSTVGPAGVLLCYHKDKSKIEKIAKAENLDYFSAALGVDGLRKER